MRIDREYCILRGIPSDPEHRVYPAVRTGSGRQLKLRAMRISGATHEEHPDGQRSGQRANGPGAIPADKFAEYASEQNHKHDRDEVKRPQRLEAHEVVEHRI